MAKIRKWREQTEESHHLQPETVRRILWIVLPLLILLLVGEGDLQYAFYKDNWLSLHSILETFSIVVSLLIFSIGWHSYNKNQSGNMILLACAFLAVGLLDYGHVMTYTGMPDFITPSSPQKGIYFWLAARLVGGVALIGAALLPWKPFESKFTRYAWLVGILVLVACIYWVGLFHMDIVPATFIPGEGLTSFKVGLEYLIMALYAATVIILLIRIRKPQPFDVKNLLISAIVMIMSEVWFTLYTTIDDSFNFIGHVYKIIAYYFLYRAVFVENVRRPYQQLSQSESLLKKNEEWLSTTLTSIGDAVIVTDSEGRINFMNPIAERLTGWTLTEAAEKDIKEIFHIVNETSREEVESPVTKVIQEGIIVGLANHTVLIAKDGSEVCIDDSAAPIRVDQGEMQGVVLVFRDVTDRKQAADKLRVAKEQLESFLTHAADVVALFDLKGHVLQINPAYEKIFGWTVEEVVGHKLPSIPQNINNLEEIFEKVKREGPISGMETVRARKDGQRIDVSVTYSPVRDALGNVVAISGILRDITERKQRENEQKRLLTIIETTTDFVATADSHGRVLYYNKAARNMLGIDVDEDISSIIIAHAHPEWAGKLVLNEALPTAAKEGSWSGETAFLNREGIEIPVHQIILAHQGSNGEIEYYSTVARNLTDLKKNEEKERLTSKMFESILDGIIVTDVNGSIVSVNPAFQSITGYKEEEAIGKNPSILSSGRHSQDFYEEMWTNLLQTGRWMGEIWNKRKNGENFVQETTISSVKDEFGEITHYVGIFKDITIRKEMEEKIRYQAYHDDLTDLPNRIVFLEHLKEVIMSPQYNQNRLAVLFLDLDRFKFINDTLGHGTGDLMLQELAKRLNDCVQEDDMVSRFGGDEFIILLTNLSDPQEAVIMSERILEAFSRPFEFNGQEYVISTSIGISMYPTDGDDAQSLISNADMAMYRAKEQGNHYRFFLSSMSDLSAERLKLENDLRKALNREEFILHYQPKIDLKTKEIIGVEALVRWQHPELGMIPPSKFIPLAEETGLILPLGEWVLRTACRQNKTWQEEDLPSVRVAVNLSIVQFQNKNLTEMIASILTEVGLAPQFLELELTESMIMSNPETTIKVIRELKEMGIQISLDDFGTGYSSLSYLKQLPLDVLKIDRTFIQNMKTNSDEMYITKAVIDLAHSLKMKVIAEGVETEEQVQILCSCQCDQIQGYYFSTPITAKEMNKYLQ